MAPMTARSRLGGGRRRHVGLPPPPAPRRWADRGHQLGGLYLRMSSEARRAAFDVQAEQNATSLRSRSPLSGEREVVVAVATSSQTGDDDDRSDSSSSSNDRCGAPHEKEEEEQEEAQGVGAGRRVATRRRSAVVDDAADDERLFTPSPSAGDDDGGCRGSGKYSRNLPEIKDSHRKLQPPSWGGEWRYEQPAALSRRQRQLLLENAVAAAADSSNGGEGGGGADCRERLRTVVPALAASRRPSGRPPQRRMLLQPLAGASAALRRQPTVLFETTPRGYDSRYRAVALRALEGLRSAEEEQEQERLMGEIREAAVQKCLPWLQHAIAN